MTGAAPGSALYAGDVVHTRLVPRPHKLRYRVTALLADLETIAGEARALALLGCNRRNLIAFYDRDHGAGDGERAADYGRRLFADAGIAVARIKLLCYPRVLGYVFNPVSVYYGFDSAGVLAGLIYEVNNTYRERRSYVVPAGTDRDGVYAHGCAKHMAVSPFTSNDGRYGFQITQPGDDLLLGIRFSDATGPVIKTHFRAHAQPLTDATLARLLLTQPAMTFMVTAAIHWEALQLYLKGVPLVRRRPGPRHAISVHHG